MSTLTDRLKEDIHYIESLNSCMNCGVCTAICPSAEFYNYDPRVIVDTVQRQDEESLENLLKSENCVLLNPFFYPPYSFSNHFIFHKFKNGLYFLLNRICCFFFLGFYSLCKCCQCAGNILQFRWYDDLGCFAVCHFCQCFKALQCQNGFICSCIF